MDEISKEMGGAVVAITNFITGHVEKFAAAFIKETGLDPTKVKMVQQRIADGFGVEIWFEPFPKESEIEMYRVRTVDAEAEAVKARDMVERLIEAHSFGWIKRDFATKSLAAEWQNRAAL